MKVCRCGRGGHFGFTLLELVVALTIGVLLVGLGGPMAVKMYENMQYRDAVRGVASAASAARLRAMSGGRAVDLMLEPDALAYSVQPAETAFDREQARYLDGRLSLGVVSARQLVSEPGVAVIRFYPDGSSTGGSVTLQRDSGQGVRLRVDWLLGRTTREALEL